MGWGRVTETELMPDRGGDYTELLVSKLKKCNRLSKPNFERVPNPVVVVME